jgi:uncharacterized protein YuzB (UPF0349 family)
MSIELMIDNDEDDIDMDVVKYECWYWSVIDSMAELVMNNGRDRVMADVAETVLRRLGEGYVLPTNDEQLPMDEHP